VLCGRLRSTCETAARMPVPNPADSRKESASDIRLFDVATDEPFSAAPVGSVMFSSVPLAWRGIIVEWNRLAPWEMPEHYIVGHGLSVHTGDRPIDFGWCGGRGRDIHMNPGQFHMMTDGENNSPRWLQTFDNVSFLLDPQFVAAVVSDGLPADRIAFAGQRAANDEIVVGYTAEFRAELVNHSMNGLLYAETLTIGFIMHLLARYAITRPKVRRPRGKLNSMQLRTVADFIQSNLSQDVSLIAMAEQAHVSPFHFARQFRATVGLSPHQYVLRQRVQRSVRLLESGKLPLAQVAAESGFHDQAHFTHSFRRILGTTPASYAAQR
jgi:AraC family transcriptional regulator